MAGEIDPVKFGELSESVKNLTKKLDEFAGHVEKINARMVVIESHWRFGKGAMFGIVIGAGFAVKGVLNTIADFFNVP